jgi:plasmid stability protein
MADIVLRNLDDALKEQLRRRAARHGRSMNAELREIVREALTAPQGPSRSQWKQLSADIRALSAGRSQTPSETLLRADRNRR